MQYYVRKTGAALSGIFLAGIVLAALFCISPPPTHAATIGKPPYLLTLTSGLVGHWTFDGRDMPNGKALDISGQGNHGSPTNIATSTFYAPGKIGQGVSFDGVDDYVTAPETSSLNITDDTISYGAWFYPRRSDSYQLIVGDIGTLNSDAGRQYTVYTQINNTSGLYLTIKGVNTGVVSLASPWVVNKWNHLFVVYDGVTLSVYLDGVLVSSTAKTGNITDVASSVIYIGSEQGQYFKMNGLIDDARVYNRALSAAEITQLYNLGAAKLGVTKTTDPLRSGLVGHWTFDGRDMTSGVARDISGQGNNGALVNIATSTFYAPGKMGQGGNFDGVNDRVITGSDFVGMNPLSISTWVKIRSFTNGDRLVTNQNTTGFFLRIISGTNRFQFSGNGGADVAASANDTAVVNQWIHVTVTRDSSGTANIYLNGVLSGTADQNSGTPQAGSTNVTIGGHFGGVNVIPGLMDDVRIYNRVLSTSEITQLYNLGAAKAAVTVTSDPLKSGLVGHWTFDGRDMPNGAARDISGQGNNGTVRNIATSTFYVPGKIGQGPNFDGSNDCIDAGNSSSLDITGAVTVAAWLKPRVLNSVNIGIVGKTSLGGSAINGQYALGGITNNRVQFTVAKNDGGASLLISQSTTDSVPNNTWTFVVGTYDGVDTTRLYINGVQNDTDTTASFGTLNQSSKNLEIGNSHGGSICNGTTFSGTIDDVRVYNRALTAAEVAQLYNLGK